MPRRPAPPTRRPRRDAGGRAGRSWKRAPKVATAAVLVVVLIAIAAWILVPESPMRLRSRAEAEAGARAWEDALRDWKAVNRGASADAASWLGEARAALALGRAALAEDALRKAIEIEPVAAEPWLIWLEILRLEDRTTEARRAGWEAFAAVAPADRRAVLRAATLALLADAGDDLARATLARWIAADPEDIEARVALLRRLASDPRAGDPDRAARIEQLRAILGRRPEHVAAREALVVALADAGEPERGRLVLEAWPESARDARFDRLRGRWALEYDHQPAEAAEAFRKVVEDWPHDWKSWYGLARAATILGHAEDARRAADAVARLREALDPGPLGHRLDADLDHLDDPASRRDLAELCDRIGLARLADAWRRDGFQAGSGVRGAGFGRVMPPANRGRDGLPTAGPR